MRRDQAFCLAILVLGTLAVEAQIGMAGFGGGRGEHIPGTAAIKSDIKYIKCDVCNEVAKQAYRQVKAAEKDAKNKKLSELGIIEILENLSDPDHDEGEWIAHIDLVEAGDRLLLKEMEDMGKCGSECKTIQRAAEEVIEGIDTDMAEKLWQGKMSRSQFTNWLCQSATDSCKDKPPTLPDDRPQGEEFVVSDPEEAKMQKMMAKMKEMGMGGQVFNRDQAKRMADGGEGDDYDEYGDDSNPKPEMGEFPGGTAPEDDLKEDSDSEAIDKASAAGQSVADKAADGWATAKQAGSDLLGKTKNLFSAENADEASGTLSPEL